MVLIAEIDKKNWIVIPEEFTNGKYRAEMSPGRLAFNSAVEKAGKELVINYQNSSRDSLGREFVGNNNWFDSLKLNLALGVGTPDLREFIDYGNLLYQGMNGKIKVYDVSGNQLNPEFLKNLFDDYFFTIRNSQRANWFDADFKEENGGLYLNSKHILDSKGNLIPDSHKILDKDTLMKDRTLGISLDNYILKNHTSQGLPSKKVKYGDFYYFFPGSYDNNSVASFNAISDRAILYCYGDPLGRNSDLGVFSIARNE